MTTAVQIREWLRETMTSRGLTVERWADRAGVAKSTIFRALKPEYEFVTSSRTLSKLAEAAGAEAPFNKSKDKVAPRYLPVRYRVQAGLWHEMDAEIPPEQAELAVLPDRRFDRFPQWLEQVVGDSVDLKIAPGSYAHVVDAIELGYSPKHGDWVVVERRRDQGCVRERTIKQVELRGGRIELWPRSRNPKWSEPVSFTAGARAGDIEVEIVGLVIGSYNSDF